MKKTTLLVAVTECSKHVYQSKLVVFCVVVPCSLAPQNSDFRDIWQVEINKGMLVCKMTKIII
jgi:hypothetical protein